MVALVWAIGLRLDPAAAAGARFVAGLGALGGSQLKRQLGAVAFRAAGPGALARRRAGRAGTVLVAVPGLVTTVLGLLLLVPPTRAAARPALAALAPSRLGRHAPLITAVAVGRRRYAVRRTPAAARDYIDGEVIDVTDVGLSPRPVGRLIAGTTGSPVRSRS